MPNHYNPEIKMENSYFCPICKSSSIDKPAYRPDALQYTCRTCGRFVLSGSVESNIQNLEPAEASILSGFIANSTRDVMYANPNDITIIAFSGKEIDIHSGNYERIISNAPVPRNAEEMINRLLIWISRACWRVDYRYQINFGYDYSLIYAQSAEELRKIVDWAIAHKFLERHKETMGSPVFCNPTLEGWNHLREIEKNTLDINRAFVATWFDDSIDPIYKNGIKPALEETGYSAIWMKMLEHNEKIDDRIIAEIRNSGLMIADFTGNRGGVYFEAGFALGLGIPVIWCCRNVEDETDNLHFDTRQYNHIFWDDEQDLKKKLIDRIKATIPGKAS
jgi:nucleoside 2-deoxyribosyltransferase